MTAANRVRTWFTEVTNAARRTRERVAARLERDRSVDADASSSEVRSARWLCRACGTTYDSRRDECRICGGRMVERVPERAAGPETDLVESPGNRAGR